MSDPQQNAPHPNAALDAKEVKRFARLKKKAKRFRVLVIGGANAGKTTILKKICNTANDPEIFDGEGEKIDINLEPTILRGDHDIANEMMFRDNPTFIFHDSCGFEAGGVDEFRRVKTFLSEHAREKRLKDQVHIIWYCIALDDDRPITYAERQFFSESGTGKVPVIVIFTKCEALELKAIEALGDEGYDFDEAVEKAPKYVEEKLKNTHKMLEVMKYPPKGHVYFQELDKQDKDCQELVECTVQALDSKILQGLFISTQQNSLELAIKYSLRNNLKKALSYEKKRMNSSLRIETFKNVLEYFPYHYDFGNFEDNELRFLLLDKDLDLFEGNNFDNFLHDQFFTFAVSESLAQLASNYKQYPPASQLIHYICALLILAEHLSVIWSSKPVSSKDVLSTVTLYQKSISCDKVMYDVDEILSKYQGPIPTPISWGLNTQQEELSSKLLCIVLENRLGGLKLYLLLLK